MHNIYILKKSQQLIEILKLKLDILSWMQNEP